eukprot:TRINITY_DN2687_c0_g1_i3.p1 TRINITY_DN2687_c0_g1~~TRINITY_DN2687_c0_g1_i3.p1  ORF type:complete len:309 (+),score=101.54 TRINITY_DN2687_c0_g1_i3:107-1033(+)
MEEEESMIPQGTSRKSQIKQINDFKLRVLEYVSIFLKANAVSAKSMHVACSLADAMKIAVQDGNVDLYQKARTILSELSKNKEIIHAAFKDEEVVECASQMLGKMFKYDARKGEGYKLVLLFCLKVLELQKGKRKLIIPIIRSLLQGFLTKKTKSLQENFFLEYFGQHLDIGWSLIIPLVKLIFPKESQGARTEMQRKVALKLTMRIIRQTGRTKEAKVIEKALKKYESLTELVLKALETKGWKKPAKFWNYFLTIFTVISNTLAKNGMEDMAQVKKVKEKTQTLLKEKSKEPIFKGKLKEMEMMLKA